MALKYSGEVTLKLKCGCKPMIQANGAFHWTTKRKCPTAQGIMDSMRKGPETLEHSADRKDRLYGHYFAEQGR